MKKIFLFILFLSYGVFIGCGPSERELELEKKLQQVIEMQEATSKQFQATKESLQASQDALMKSQDALMKSQDALMKSKDELRVLMQAEQERLDEQNKQCKLTGSVFIVTNGGTNYKLGLTHVAAITKEEFLELESRAIDLVNKFIVDNSKVYKEAEVVHLQVKEKLDLLYTKYSTAKKKLDSMISSYRPGGFRYNANIDVSVLNFMSSNVRAYKGHHDLARSIQASLNAQVAIIETIVKEWKETHTQLFDADSTMREIAQNAEYGISNYVRSLASGTIQLAETKTRTNADGDFSLNLSRGMDYVVVAYADRLVGDSTEKYNWFIPYTTSLIQEDHTILISNDSIASNPSPVTSGLNVFVDPQDYEWITFPIRKFKLTLLDKRR